MKKEEITLVNIDAPDLMEKNPKLVLGLIWTLILKLQIGDSGSNAKNELLKWVNKQIKPFEGAVPQCKNFTTSFQDGKALCALCEALAEESFDGCKNLPKPKEAVDAALETAESEFEIPPLMDADDILNAADEHSMMTYVSMFRDWQETGEFLPDTEKCYAEGEGVSMGLVGNKPFTIFCRDQNGKLSPAPEDPFTITIETEDGEEVDCEQEETSQGIIACKYVADTAGTYTITITDAEETPIRGSPYQCKVRDGEERSILDPPDDCIFTILDKKKDYHSYISDDGDCVNKYGDILGYINVNSLEVGSPEQDFWGQMIDDKIYNSLEREIGEVDRGKGYITDADGSTVCEISRIGLLVGNGGTTLGQIENFNYKQMSVAALYLLLVDDDMLIEEEDD